MRHPRIQTSLGSFFVRRFADISDTDAKKTLTFEIIVTVLWREICGRRRLHLLGDGHHPKYRNAQNQSPKGVPNPRKGLVKYFSSDHFERNWSQNSPEDRGPLWGRPALTKILEAPEKLKITGLSKRKTA